MDIKEFFEICVKEGAVVAPIQVYSDYDENGNLSDKLFIGIKYAVFYFDNFATGPDYWVAIDDSQLGMKNLYDTPEAAIESITRK